jgi:hypothetical protein
LLNLAGLLNAKNFISKKLHRNALAVAIIFAYSRYLKFKISTINIITNRLIRRPPKLAT